MPRKRSELPYTRGDINRAIDLLLHPWFKQYPWFTIIDEFLHTLNEGGNPEEAMKKFMRYNFPTLLEEIAKWLKSQK
jgi:hypothetical protein